MMTQEKIETAARVKALQERVNAFNALELPGQPYSMHLGTMDLVAELMAEVKAASALSMAEPEGWKLVPVEPTEEMEFAGLKAADPFIGKTAIYDAELSSATYSAMLAVAPSVPSSIAEPAAWRTMESAPKDGRAVLLLSLAYDTHNDADDTTYHHPAKCHIGKWNPAGDSWTDELGGYAGEICTLTVTGGWDSGGGWFEPNEITHWQPLPAAPSAPSVGQPLPGVSSSGEREDASDPSLSAGPPVGQEDGAGRETLQTILDLINPLHGALDLQTYDEKVRTNFDAPADTEYFVDITAQQERGLTQAVCILENRLATTPTSLALHSPSLPCRWEGGRAGGGAAACQTCGIEYNYRIAARPACPRIALEAERAQLLAANEAATGWASTVTTAAAFKCIHPACQDNTTGKCKGACSFTAANQIPAQPVSGTEGRFDAASCWAWLNHVDSKDVETIIEQFTKSNCLEYTPEEERFGIQRALRGTVEGLLARALSSEATTASLQSQLSEARAICKSLSDTLLKLRPLGGSECFSRHGRDDTEAYYADPAYFSDLIAHDKNGWLEDRKHLIRTERDLAAAHTTIAELRGALEPIQNALQKQVNLLRFQARNSTSGLARALIETSEVWQTFCDNAEAALAPAGEKQR